MYGRYRKKHKPKVRSNSVKSCHPNQRKKHSYRTWVLFVEIISLIRSTFTSSTTQIQQRRFNAGSSSQDQEHWFKMTLQNQEDHSNRQNYCFRSPFVWNVLCNIQPSSSPCYLQPASWWFRFISTKELIPNTPQKPASPFIPIAAPTSVFCASFRFIWKQHKPNILQPIFNHRIGHPVWQKQVAIHPVFCTNKAVLHPLSPLFPIPVSIRVDGFRIPQTHPYGQIEPRKKFFVNL